MSTINNNSSDKVNSNDEFTLFNIHPNKKVESTQKLIKMLINDWLANIASDEKTENISPDRIEEHITKLLKWWKISQTEYVQYFIKSWSIMFLEFLMYKNVISEIASKMAIYKQKEKKQNNEDSQIGNILMEMKLINNFDKFAEAINELKILKLWEYLMLKKLITYEQLMIAYEIQKKQKEIYKNWKEAFVDKLWVILVNKKIIKQYDLNKAMKELWLDTEEIYELKY